MNQEQDTIRKNDIRKELLKKNEHRNSFLAIKRLENKFESDP
jgi:hypothetical protein